MDAIGNMMKPYSWYKNEVFHSQIFEQPEQPERLKMFYGILLRRSLASPCLNCLTVLYLLRVDYNVVIVQNVNEGATFL